MRGLPERDVKSLKKGKRAEKNGCFRFSPPVCRISGETGCGKPCRVWTGRNH
nr:MAG TPA: Bacterial TniB protein [Caudoviricetes sp.]